MDLTGFVAKFFPKILVGEWDGMIARGSHGNASPGQKTENKSGMYLKKLCLKTPTNLKKKRDRVQKDQSSK